MIQAFVGSGGKTGTINERAARLRAQGLRVLVTTTTHMGRREETILGDDPQPIIRALRETGYALAGQPVGEVKIGALSEATYLAACAEADAVLVEADGSRQLPLKFPADYEPVIPANAEEIVVIAGMSALDHPAKEVCQRLELVKACLGIGDDARITPEHIERLLREGYVKRLRARYPDKKLTVLPRQCDTLYKRALGSLLAAGEPVSLLRPEWFEPQPTLFICGAGHVGQALANMAAQLDYAVTVFDDRPEFATRERLPHAQRIICDSFDRLPAYVERGSYCVIAAHGHELDARCLRALLNSGYAYLGMLASRQKAAKTFELLRAQGVPQDVIDTIHAPIGLDIGASTPGEIAVSILGEIIRHKSLHGASQASRALLESDEPGVLCVVTEKLGTAPRGAGSMMLVTASGTIDSVGGGLLEQAVVRDARCTVRAETRLYDIQKGRCASPDEVTNGGARILLLPLDEEMRRGVYDPSVPHCH